MFLPGEYVLFVYNGEVRHLRIKKIVIEPEGEFAVFEPGCACKAMKISTNKIYRTPEELKKAEAI